MHSSHPVRKFLNDLGYISRDWSQVRLNDDDGEDGGERWLGYAEREGYTFAVTASSVTGKWAVEILEPHEYYTVKDSNAK